MRWASTSTPAPRYIPEEKTLAILRALPPFIEPVALFVNELLENMIPAARRLELIATIQYHGEQLAPCPAAPFRFIPAFAIKDTDSLALITTFIDAAAAKANCRRRCCWMPMFPAFMEAPVKRRPGICWRIFIRVFP